MIKLFTSYKEYKQFEEDAECIIKRVRVNDKYIVVEIEK
jgi:hypothetical protein